MKKQLIYIGTLVVVGMTALIGCQDPESPTPTPATAPSTIKSNFQFVNASPDAPALNFFVENGQIGQTQTFGSAGTGYASSASGVVQLRGKAATGTIGGVLGSNDILYRATTTNQVNFAALSNTNYTIFVVDTLNRPKPVVLNGTNLGGPQFVVVTDTIKAPTAGNSRIRLFNFAPNLSTASVRLLDSTGKATVSLAGRTFRATSAALLSYTSVPKGKYTAQVFSGSTIPATGSPAASTVVTLADGKIYTLYVKGLNNGTGAKALGVGVVQHN